MLSFAGGALFPPLPPPPPQAIKRQDNPKTVVNLMIAFFIVYSLYMFHKQIAYFLIKNVCILHVFIIYTAKFV